MGSITERITKKGSSFRVQIRKNKNNIAKTFSTKEEAEKFIQMHEKEIVSENPVMYLPLSVYIDRYIEENIALNKVKNIYLYEMWREFLGAEIAPNISVEQIEHYLKIFAHTINNQKRVPSPETVRKMTCALSSVYTKAVKEWKWCKKNPVTDVSSTYKKNNVITYKRPDATQEMIDFKNTLKESILKKFPNKSSKEIRLALGLQKTTYNYLWNEHRGTTTILLIECLKKIGLTLTVVPLRVAEPLQDDEP